MRRPNCSSMTTTSPRAIGRPLTSRSTGLSARRSRVTTEPGPRLIVSPRDMFVRPTSTVSSTVTSVRRDRSASVTKPAAPAPSGRGVNSTSFIAGSSLLGRDVREQEVLPLYVGRPLQLLEDRVAQLLAALLGLDLR